MVLFQYRGKRGRIYFNLYWTIHYNKQMSLK